MIAEERYRISADLHDHRDGCAVMHGGYAAAYVASGFTVSFRDYSSKHGCTIHQQSRLAVLG